MLEANRSRADLLLAGGLIVTLDNRWDVVEDGAIAVRDGDILEIGPTQELCARYTARETIDASGAIVMPGLVNAHTHAATTMFRGLADDKPLKQWLEEYIWPAEKRFVNPESVRCGTLLAIAEMIRGGVTTFLDMYFFEDSVAEAAKQSGMRVVLGEALFETAGPNKLPFPEALDFVRHLLDAYRGDPLVSVAVQPHSTYTVSPDNLLRAKAVADEFGAIFGLHASETALEVDEVRRKTGYSPPQLLARLGLLDERVVLFHGVHLDNTDIATLAEKQAGLVHCPEANLKLGSGIAPLPALLRAGVRVALGTDGPASNNDLDLWGEVQMASKIHRGVAGDPLAVTARQVLEMATRVGADLLGLGDQVGSLEAGKRADMILIGLDEFHLVPLYDVYSHLACAVGRGDVDTVIVNGRPVMRQRQMMTVNEGEVIARVRETGAEIRHWLDTR
jgi:5-methylthioadenosine/S-adenosylhomocysteine deaminase